MKLSFSFTPFGNFRTRFTALAVGLGGGFAGYAFRTGMSPFSSEFWLTLASVLASAWGTARSLRYFEGEVLLGDSDLSVPQWTLRGKCQRVIPLSEIRSLEVVKLTRSLMIHLKRDSTPVMLRDAVRLKDPRDLEALKAEVADHAKPVTGLSEGSSLLVRTLMARVPSPRH